MVQDSLKWQVGLYFGVTFVETCADCLVLNVTNWYLWESDTVETAHNNVHSHSALNRYYNACYAGPEELNWIEQLWCKGQRK